MTPCHTEQGRSICEPVTSNPNPLGSVGALHLLQAIKKELRWQLHI